MQLDNARALVAATVKKRKLEAELRDVKEEIDRLEKSVLMDMAEDGLPGIKLVVARRRWALASSVKMYVKKRPEVAAEDVVAALKRCRLGSLVHETYNANQLSAWARERLGVEKKPLPEQLLAVVVPDSYTEVSVTSASKESSVSEVAAETAARQQKRTPAPGSSRGAGAGVSSNQEG
jgi:hypothetical protein